MAKFVFCLMGPTASYKTHLACELSTVFPLEIISVDSAMIYQGMDIGTAKPSALLLERFPHHLVDIINPTETYSAAQFCDDVHLLIKDSWSRGKWPFLVGGTMMYFNALQQGLSSLPEADIEIRKQLLAQAEEQGWAALHAELTQIDPFAASRIHTNDTQRIQRALEVYRITGRSLTELCQSPKEHSLYTFVNLILFPEQRDKLHRRIEQRFKQMLDDNLIAEVISLLQTWPLALDAVSLRSVGYRQVVEYLRGDYGQTALYEKGAAATRQLAKRQLTWLRHWPQNAMRFDIENFDNTQAALISTLLRLAETQ
ncbi:MAG: tRNA (adenosine(37)-N6)-dimethylallyltransferase MiaA [Legionella sp.]|nr:tRNA (adenosine(37)-N6)-dimethylallyltransferase MiaA [Legionella sp.]